MLQVYLLDCFMSRNGARLLGLLQDWEHQAPRQGILSGGQVTKGQLPLGGARGVLAPSPSACRRRRQIETLQQPWLGC